VKRSKLIGGPCDGETTLTPPTKLRIPGAENMVAVPLPSCEPPGYVKDRRALYVWNNGDMKYHFLETVSCQSGEELTEAVDRAIRKYRDGQG
jgi:hypothetical protein